MHSFSVSIVLAAIIAVASTAAVPAAEAGPFFHSLDVGYATVPYVNKRDELGATKKRDLTNIRPLLSRSEEHMLFQRTYPSTPTTGPDAGKCGAVAGYACTSGNGACCAGPGSGDENMCGDTPHHCAGACQRPFGYCTDPIYQIAFDADDGDVLWDPITDNVFDASLGDGMIYYGYPLLDPETDLEIPWPSTV